MAQFSHWATSSSGAAGASIPGKPGSRLGGFAMRKPHATSIHGYRSAALESQVAELTPAEEQALEEFGNWLDGELDRLVARWIHCAAPNASHRERVARRLI